MIVLVGGSDAGSDAGADAGADGLSECVWGVGIFAPGWNSVMS